MIEQKQLKPRAFIVNAHERDFAKIQAFVKTQCPDARLVFVTSAPPGSAMRVFKDVPMEYQKPIEQIMVTYDATEEEAAQEEEAIKKMSQLSEGKRIEL